MDPTRFNYHVLGRPGYWTEQRRICRSVMSHRTTVVTAGNAVGKSYVAAGVLLWFLFEHPGCLVVSTAPTQTQLEEVLWKEVRRAHTNSFARLDGDLLKNPLKIDLGDGWQALGYSTTKTERLSGHHAKDMLVIVDEASGVAPEIFEAIDSLNPSRYLLIGNPLRPEGKFYDLANHESELVNVLAVPSLLSPDIGLPRSQRGLADATWLASARNDYGEGSLWWLAHVLAQFPDAAADTVFPRSWLDTAERATHAPAGPNRLAIDLGGGEGGDKTVLIVRDDNGVREIEHAANWSLEATATRAGLLSRKWDIMPMHVAFDKAGIGWDFNNRLQAVGIKGARGYLGGLSGGVHANLRSASAWVAHQRLDPGFQRLLAGGDLAPQPPFAIRPEHMKHLRRELQALTYSLTITGGIALIPAEDVKKKLNHSPDFAAALLISFAFP